MLVWQLPAPVPSWSRDPKLAYLCYVKTSSGIQHVQPWEWGVGHPVELKSERDCKEPQQSKGSLTGYQSSAKVTGSQVITLIGALVKMLRWS